MQTATEYAKNLIDIALATTSAAELKGDFNDGVTFGLTEAKRILEQAEVNFKQREDIATREKVLKEAIATCEALEGQNYSANDGIQECVEALKALEVA